MRLESETKVITTTTKLTKALISDLQIPEVDAQLIGANVRLLVAVHADGVDMKGVSVGELPPEAGLHHRVDGDVLRQPQRALQLVGGGGRGAAGKVDVQRVVRITAAANDAAAAAIGELQLLLHLPVLLRELPQFDGLVIGGQHEVGGILARVQPADLVDLLLNLQTLQVVELRLVRLKGTVEVVLVGALSSALQKANTKGGD